MNDKTRIAIFSAIELACAIYLLLTGHVLADHFVLMALEILALMIGAFAVFNVLSNQIDLGEYFLGNYFITDGIYSIVRHPIYLSIFAMSLILIIDTFSILRLLVWVALLINTLLKLRVDERILSSIYPEYEDYKKRTKKLIPFIY